MTVYTVEPWDFDTIFGLDFHETSKQLGGPDALGRGPHVKIPYPSTGYPWDNQKGVDTINAWVRKGTIKAGDTIMGFSLGTQVISQYLGAHIPPAGIRFLLVGDTFARNADLLVAGKGVPLNIANEVTMIAREFDGWSDSPTRKTSRWYQLAYQNAVTGTQCLHNYQSARLDDPANVVTKQGNITAILVPTQKLPCNLTLRSKGKASAADALDVTQRPQIVSTYDRTSPTPQQLAAATKQQVA